MTSVSPLVHGDMISWSKNIKSISAKANSLLGMIRRSIRFDAPSPDKFQLYVSHVRSILGYCSPLWSPSNVLLLERVQRHATKYILNNYSDMSYAERWYNWISYHFVFAERLLISCYFINIYIIMLTVIFLVILNLSDLHIVYGPLTKVHCLNYCLITTALQVSYFYRNVRLWNSLPRHIREASSVFSFKKHVIDLYFSILCNFNINERCTYVLVFFVVHSILVVLHS